MEQYLLKYGLGTGAAMAVGMIAGFYLAGATALTGWLGVVIGFASLGLVFLGLKRYRDVDLGGFIGFGGAFALGAAMTFLASLLYSIVWEIHGVSTGYAYYNELTQDILANARQDGASQAVIGEAEQLVRQMRAQHGSLIYRLYTAFFQVLPPGLLVSLASAAILQNEKFLPPKRPERKPLPERRPSSGRQVHRRPGLGR